LAVPRSANVATLVWPACCQSGRPSIGNGFRPHANVGYGAGIEGVVGNVVLFGVKRRIAFKSSSSLE